jgi:hypothetical protein
MPVAHVCNPNYLRGRDQKDRCSKPALANSSRDPILKNPSQKKKKKKKKRAGGMAQGVGPELKHEHCKTKNKKVPNTKKGLAEWLK